MKKINKICIIGMGTFGSYLLSGLIKKYGTTKEIIIVEVGDKKIKNEKEIGYKSISKNSTVGKDGRYFGFGGTSARWGGQVLFFDERDNPNKDIDWTEIVNISNKFNKLVTNNLLNTNINFDFQERNKNIKTGIWLKYSKRNTYKNLKKDALINISIIKNQRITDFKINNCQIEKVIMKDNKNKLSEIDADIFYLTAGALESCRLLLKLDNQTNLFKNTDLGKNFGDHISTELFKIKNSLPIINTTDFTPYFYNGNLITKRLIIKNKDNLIAFAHCIFNKDIKAFTFIKELLFGKRETKVSLKDFLYSFDFLYKFLYHILFKKNIYIDSREWSLQLDLEQSPRNKNELILSDSKDSFDEQILEIKWNVTEGEKEMINELRLDIEKILKENNLNYESVFSPSSQNNKVEDVFHPVGSMRMGFDDKAICDFYGKVKKIDNLYHFSTSLFPSAKSINPSASVCCFIENHLSLDYEK